MKLLNPLNSLMKKNKSARPTHPQAIKLIELYRFIKYIHYLDSYIARSDYMDELKKYDDTLIFFQNLESSDTFSEFLKKQGWKTDQSIDRIRRFLTYVRNLSSHTGKKNAQFLSSHLESEKEYLDHILDPVDSEIILDENQRKVILSDEDYMMVIAGAGAGKTTTVAAKVRYLVEKKGIKPDKILVISFTNKAVSELRHRINRNLNIPCPIGTFHATGNTILKRKSEEKLNIVEGSTLYFQIQKYLCQTALKEERTVHDLILFFGTYFDSPYEGNEIESYFYDIISSNHETLKSELDEYHKKVINIRSKKTMTIQAEILRSREEVEIANYLYLNGIDYTYEDIYPYYLPGTDKPYTPDFHIKQGHLDAWIEHFGITESGYSSRYSQEQLIKYKTAANQKYYHHKNHGTPLIFTYSTYLDGRSRTDHLKEKLEEAGFVMNPRPEGEIIAKLTAGQQSKYVRRLISLLVRFIENFKTNGYQLEDFDRMKTSTDNVRSHIFLNIARDCYIEYQRYLKNSHSIDFQDMINESAKMLRKYKESGQSLPFDYIIVDEYQDISRQRFDLIKSLQEISHAKIIAVGDDWQSIYAFSGSDISLFTQFSKKMGYASQMTIDRTYRNSQELIDIAGSFIQKNKNQISKSLISKRHIKNPIIIYTYDAYVKRDKNDPTSGVGYAIAKCLENVIGQILTSAQEEKRIVSNILLIGRFGFDSHHLEHSNLFEYNRHGNSLTCLKHPKVKIFFMTAHASKGLGYDEVIVLNGKNDKYGFPSKIKDDPVLSFVVHQDFSIEYAEERRLFYVALTRTKNRVYFIAPEQNPSEFLLELKRDYKNVSLRGYWSEENAYVGLHFKACPICGYPLRLRYKPSIGLRLYICSNDPEICDFMTNDYAGGRLSIRKCNRCKDGYLIVRSTRDKSHYFLGCTNYKPGGKGCNNTKNR